MPNVWKYTYNQCNGFIVKTSRFSRLLYVTDDNGNNLQTPYIGVKWWSGDELFDDLSWNTYIISFNVRSAGPGQSVETERREGPGPARSAHRYSASLWPDWLETRDVSLNKRHGTCRCIRDTGRVAKWETREVSLYKRQEAYRLILNKRWKYR